MPGVLPYPGVRPTVPGVAIPSAAPGRHKPGVAPIPGVAPGRYKPGVAPYRGVVPPGPGVKSLGPGVPNPV